MTAADNNLRLAFNVDTGKYPGMDDQELFDVRQFSVHEEMSGLFEVNVVAIVEEPNIPLDAFVGRAAAFRAQTPNPSSAHPIRVWAGICSHMSHLHGADPGQSAYHFCIVPALWRTTMRKNSRIYQHKSTPDIVKALLAEWQITATWNLVATYNAHEYCVQYEETDYQFLSRLLEDAGISFCFQFNANTGKGNDMVGLVFDDAPQTARKANTRVGSLTYAGNQTPAFGSLADFCTTVSITQRVRPGKMTVRDFDFRLPLTLNLNGAAAMASNPESVYEQFEYAPGEFLWEPGKADEGPKALADKYSNGKPARSVADDQKKALASTLLEAERRRHVLVAFHTNAIDLRPGLILSINQEASGTTNHPRSDLSPTQKLVVIETHLEGEHAGEWSMTTQAVYNDFPLRPERRTPKPRVFGVQSAIVVGPAGQEIWTDEFGRVRVQFHWDREGKYDDNSSCWMRVSQAWAGGGFGAITIPRVGHEVIVQFFEGNPDLPIIVGRVYNLASPVPYPLPASQTVSGLKSNSSPGGSGYNEIKFDDKKGAESISVQAQLSLSTVVNASESRSVGGGRDTKIGGAESLNVVGARTTTIGETDRTSVKTSHALSVGASTGHVYSATDQSIVFSTGLASISIVKGQIFLNAPDGVHIHSGADLEITSAKGGTITIQGGPMVAINNIDNGPAVKVSTVTKADDVAHPGGGGPGTPPTLPHGGGSIDKPGPLSGDVDVELPSNAVELASGASPATAAATAVKGATGAAASGPLGALKTAVGSTLQSTGKSLLTTAMTDLAKGDFKDLSIKSLEKTAIGDLKTDAGGQIGSVVTAASKSLGLPDTLSKALTTAAPNLVSGGLKKFTTSAILAEVTNVLPSVAGGSSSLATEAATAALGKVTGGTVTQTLTQALSIGALGALVSGGTALAAGKSGVAAVTKAAPTPDGKGAVTTTKADPTSPTGTTDTTTSHSDFNATYPTLVTTPDGGG